MNILPFLQVTATEGKLKNEVLLYKNKSMFVNKYFQRNGMKKERETQKIHDSKERFKLYKTDY